MFWWYQSLVHQPPIPSRELTYITWGKRTSSSNVPAGRGYVRSQRVLLCQVLLFPKYLPTYPIGYMGLVYFTCKNAWFSWATMWVNRPYTDPMGMNTISWNLHFLLVTLGKEKSKYPGQLPGWFFLALELSNPKDFKKGHNPYINLFSCHSEEFKAKEGQAFLAGGFNPVEKYARQNGFIFPK